MAIDLYWDDEQQSVILAEFQGKWTWDELHQMLNTVKRLSTEREQVFGAIIDVRAGFHLPGGSVFNREGLSNFRKMLALGQDGEKGPVVVVGMGMLVRNILDAVKTVDKRAASDVFFAKDMREARQLIYREVQQFRTSA